LHRLLIRLLGGKLMRQKQQVLAYWLHGCAQGFRDCAGAPGCLFKGAGTLLVCAGTTVAQYACVSTGSPHHQPLRS
jgi:hypothetical protein